jgi:DNA repair protein SbcD/Mre11
LSDTHLGFSDFEKISNDSMNLRESDFYRSFSAAIDKILEIKPDAVIHTGDFFHRASPANRPMIEGLTQVKRLSDSKIPFIVIAGNHSTPKTIYTSPILKAFGTMENVYPVFSQKYEKITLGDFVFHALPHINDEKIYLDEFSRIEPQDDRINILMLHASVGKQFLMEEYGERIFPEGNFKKIDLFDYTAIGHWHNFQKVKGLKNAWYSGSTERLGDREITSEKGFITADFSIRNSPAVSFFPLPARAWHRLDIIDCYLKTVENIKNEINEFAGNIDVRESITSIYLQDIAPVQSVEIKNSDIAKIFSEAAEVQCRRIFRSDKKDYSGREINAHNLEDHFVNFIREKMNDGAKGELDRMIGISKKYFSISGDKKED